jgi:hypothetical protein
VCVCFLLVTLSPKAKKLLYRYILLDYIGIYAGGGEQHLMQKEIEEGCSQLITEDMGRYCCCCC